jgi:predicted HTH transcriptional regulator
MTPTELKKLIRKGESNSLEFKSHFSNEAIETIAAFSNTRGGTLLVGVSDDGNIPGLNLNKESVQQWVNEIKNKTTPSILPDIETSRIDEKVIALIQVREYPIKPVAFKGRYYKRVRNSNHLMRPDEVAQTHYKTFNSSWDYTSTPRNVQVADMFKEAGVIERYGSGIGRIVDDFKAYGLAAPEFKEVGESFIVTVSKTRLPGFHPNTIQKGLVERLAERLAESQKKILTLVQANPNISKKDLAAAVGISTTAIDKNISALKAKGLLKRVGPDKGGHWALLEAGRGKR